jgi:hypothetical protein
MCNERCVVRLVAADVLTLLRAMRWTWRTTMSDAEPARNHQLDLT